MVFTLYTSEPTMESIFVFFFHQLWHCNTRLVYCLCLITNGWCMVHIIVTVLWLLKKVRQSWPWPRKETTKMIWIRFDSIFLIMQLAPNVCRGMTDDGKMQLTSRSKKFVLSQVGWQGSLKSSENADQHFVAPVSSLSHILNGALLSCPGSCNATDYEKGISWTNNQMKSAVFGQTATAFMERGTKREYGVCVTLSIILLHGLFLFIEVHSLLWRFARARHGW